MHQPVDLACEACELTPYKYCVSCQLRDVQVQARPMFTVADFWELAREIIFKKP